MLDNLPPLDLENTAPIADKLRMATRLAEALAERILLQSVRDNVREHPHVGTLWNAASLLEEYGIPIPQAVEDTLSRVHAVREPEKAQAA